MSANRLFAIVTGASTGIGFELAKRCAQEGYELLIAADEPEIEGAAASLRGEGATVEALQADLATTEGVDKLYAAAKGRQVDALSESCGSYSRWSPAVIPTHRPAIEATVPAAAAMRIRDAQPPQDRRRRFDRSPLQHRALRT